MRRGVLANMRGRLLGRALLAGLLAGVALLTVTGTALAVPMVIAVNQTADESSAENKEACGEEKEEGVPTPQSEKCSLREALEAASRVVVTGGSKIVVQLPPGKFAVNHVKGALPIGNATGKCEEDPCSVTVAGAGPTQTRVDGADETRIFKTVENAPGVALEKLAVENAKVKGKGAGIDVESETPLLLEETLFENDEGEQGGAVFTPYSVTVRDSSFLSNRGGPEGGAVEAFEGVTIERSGLSGNSATVGGAIVTGEGGLVLDSSIVGNFASTGAAAVTSGPLAFRWSTVALNTDGPAQGALAGTGSVGMEGSILASNTEVQCSGLGAGGLTFSGVNLLFGTSTCLQHGSGPMGAEPKFSAFVRGAGEREYLALGPGSPAINAGGATCSTAAGFTGPPADEFGVARPFGAGCDLGAQEVASDVAVALKAEPDPVTVGTPLTLAAHVSDPGGAPASGVTLTVAIPAGVSVLSVPAGCTATVTTSTTVKCEAASVAAGETKAYPVVVRPEHVGGLLTGATAIAESAEYDTSDNAASAASSVVAAPVNSGPPPPGSGGNHAGAAAKATLLGSTLSVDKHGNLFARVKCAAGSTGGCNTTLDLYAASGTLPASASARKALLLARAHVTIPAGRTAFVHLRLSGAAKRKLTAAHPRMPARVLLSAHGSVGAAGTKAYAVLLKRERTRKR